MDNKQLKEWADLMGISVEEAKNGEAKFEKPENVNK